MAAIVISAGFLGAFYFFLNAYQSYEAGKTHIDNLRVRTRLMSQQMKQAEEKNLLVENANQFVQNAVSRGLGRDRWSTYDVTISEKVSFEEFERLLDQCAISYSHYFTPASLQIKLISEGTGTEKQPAPPTPRPKKENEIENQGKDMDLVLKGTFLVRTR